jgi:hypothetical protein
MCIIITIIITITITTIWSLFALLSHIIVMNGHECGAVGEMTGKRNRITLRKPAPVPYCSPQTPHYLIWARTRAIEVGASD